MLENIKRKIAHARGQPEDKVVATTQAAAAVKPETLNRVLTEVKVMRGKQEVLDNRFSEMKQENEALWREVVMLRQKHMKQQQIVNKVSGNSSMKTAAIAHPSCLSSSFNSS